MSFNPGNKAWLKNAKLPANHKAGFSTAGSLFDKVSILWKCLDFFPPTEALEIRKASS